MAWGLGLVLSELFLGTLLKVPLSIPFMVFFYKGMGVRRRGKRLTRVREGLADALIALGDALSCGLSLENAEKEAAGVLTSLRGKEDDMARSMALLGTKPKTGGSDQVLSEWAAGFDEAEMKLLAAVIPLAYRGTGECGDLFIHTAGELLQKLEVEKEIRIWGTEKETELWLMTAMPPLMLLFLRGGYGTLTEWMYETASGQILMFVLLLAYSVCFYWGMRMIEKTYV